MFSGVVKLVDVRKCPTPEALANAIKEAVQIQGFLFIIGHGLERQAEGLFRMSEDFFHNETEDEKMRCAYENNRGYTKVSQEA